MTYGEPKISGVYPLSNYTKEDIIKYAACAELRQNHPASKAIVQYAVKLKIEIPDRSHSDFKTGLGVIAKLDNNEIIVGSKKLLLEEKINCEHARDIENLLDNSAESLAYIALNKELIGLLAYTDIIRPEAKKAIKQLKKLGIKRLIMATGDGEFAANKIANQLGITEVVYKCFPEQKANIVKQLKELNYNVAVIGDGVNDSPALAYADVGISLHGATQAAQHVSDIVLTDNNLTRLPQAIESSRHAINIIKENLAIVAIPNSVGFCLAAIGNVSPVGATILNNGSAIVAAINSLRPLAFKPWVPVEKETN